MFNIKCTSFNKICHLVSVIRKCKDYQCESEVASTGNWSLINVLAAVDRVIKNTMPATAVLHCNIKYLEFLALCFLL